MGLIGNFDHMFLLNVGIDCCYPLSGAKTLPGILFAAFQMMFALMVPVIVTGAWAERMEFKAFAWFTLVWPFLVYYPLAHWIWNTNGWLAELGLLDFAGGLTIHTSTGVAALVVSSILAGRMKAEVGAIGHHNLPMFVLGGALIWGGWYSFNAGSAFSANAQAAIATCNTHLSASSGAAVWILLHYYTERKWTLTEIMNGAFAGLAAVTPGSGFVVPWSAVVIGGCGSATAFFWVNSVKPRLGVDDALDVAALQGVPGIVGTFFVGIFAQYNVDLTNPNKIGLVVGGNGRLLAIQTLGIIVTVLWTGILTYVLMWFMKRYVGVDVSPECEEKGLDLVQIGEQAYDETLAPILDLGLDILTAKLIDAAQSGDLIRTKLYVQGGAKPELADYDGRTPLHLAAAGGHLEIMKFLQMQHGVNVHAVDRYGNTPLHDAMVHNHKEAVRWLKKKGATMTADSGYVRDRDILQAAADGNLEEVKWRIKTNMLVVHAEDYDRRTALHVSSSEGHQAIVRELLRNGANAHAVDRWGLTAYQCAIKGKHQATAEELANWIKWEGEDRFSVSSSGTHQQLRSRSNRSVSNDRPSNILSQTVSKTPSNSTTKTPSKTPSMTQILLTNDHLKNHNKNSTELKNTESKRSKRHSWKNIVIEKGKLYKVFLGSFSIKIDTCCSITNCLLFLFSGLQKYCHTV